MKIGFVNPRSFYNLLCFSSQERVFDKQGKPTKLLRLIPVLCSGRP